MNYKCNVSPECGQQFSDELRVIQHFKNEHRLEEKQNEFPCYINNTCPKQYLTLKGLKNHAKKCLLSRYVLKKCMTA